MLKLLGNNYTLENEITVGKMNEKRLKSFELNFGDHETNFQRHFKKYIFLSTINRVSVSGKRLVQRRSHLFILTIRIDMSVIMDTINNYRP